jgi:hypothetical protein
MIPFLMVASPENSPSSSSWYSATEKTEDGDEGEGDQVMFSSLRGAAPVASTALLKNHSRKKDGAKRGVSTVPGQFP